MKHRRYKAKTQKDPTGVCCWCGEQHSLWVKDIQFQVKDNEVGFVIATLEGWCSNNQETIFSTRKLFLETII